MSEVRSTTRPGVLDHQRDRPTPLEIIERALWEIAACGGNVSKAARNLEEAGVVGHKGEVIPRSTLQYWMRKSHRNRYSEILTERVGDIETVIVNDATARQVQLGDAEEAAVKQTLAGLSAANGVEASTILRNLSQSKAVQRQTVDSIRERDVRVQAGESLSEIAAALRSINPNIVEVIEDAEVVEDEEAGRGPRTQLPAGGSDS